MRGISCFPLWFVCCYVVINWRPVWWWCIQKNIIVSSIIIRSINKIMTKCHSKLGNTILYILLHHRNLHHTTLVVCDEGFARVLRSIIIETTAAGKVYIIVLSYSCSHYLFSILKPFLLEQLPFLTIDVSKNSQAWKLNIVWRGLL